MEEIKIFVIGDPHFKTNNVEECNQMCQKILCYLDQIQPDAVVCLGDILDRHETIHVGPLLRSISFFESIAQKYRLYILIGNHDRPNNQVFMTEEHPFTALKLWKNTTIVDSTYSEYIQGKNFVFVPYVPPGRFMEALQGIDLNTVHTIFAHQEFYGAKMGATESVIGDKWDSEYPLVISGHIHDYQVIQKNIIYTGTPIQHAYGDREDKGVWLFRFSGNTVSSEIYDLEIPKKKIVKVDACEISTLKNLDPKHHYKIVISGTPEQIKTLKLGAYLNRLSKYKIAYKTISSITDMTNTKEFENQDFLELLYDEIKNCSEDQLDMLQCFQEIFGSIAKHFIIVD